MSHIMSNPNTPKLQMLLGAGDPIATRNFQRGVEQQQPLATPTTPANDPMAAQERDDAAARERQARGRSSTILTGGLGDTSTPNMASRTLLGLG